MTQVIATLCGGSIPWVCPICYAGKDVFDPLD